MSKKPTSLPVCKTKCATCPFRDESKLAFLRDHLTKSALTEASRICHSTGSNNAVNRRTGVPAHVCRGARDVQLNAFAAMGFIEEATDDAWQKKVQELGL